MKRGNGDRTDTSVVVEVQNRIDSEVLSLAPSHFIYYYLADQGGHDSLSTATDKDTRDHWTQEQLTKIREITGLASLQRCETQAS